MALCSLSTGSTATPLLRAASMTMPPAMTSTSLFASAIVLPASIAHSTASSAAVPDEAHSTMSTSGCEAISHSPSLPTPEISAGDPPSAARSLSIASPVRHRHRARPELEDLLHHRGDVGRRRDRHDLDTIGMRARHFERARADGAGRTKNGDALHKGSTGSKGSRSSKGIVRLAVPRGSTRTIGTAAERRPWNPLEHLEPLEPFHQTLRRKK